MKILVVLGHPYARSFNYGIFQTVVSRLKENGHEVIAHDLYREKFDPVITGMELVTDHSADPLVEQYCNEVRTAEGMVIIHPNWWGQPPAILKGWVDRVFRPKVAYDAIIDSNDKGIPVGLLKAKAVLVINTSNTSEEKEAELFGDPLDTLWRKCTFRFCGVENFHRKLYTLIDSSTEEQRKGWLREAEALLDGIFEKAKGNA